MITIVDYNEGIYARNLSVARWSSHPPRPTLLEDVQMDLQGYLAAVSNLKSVFYYQTILLYSLFTRT